MKHISNLIPGAARYELRFTSLFNRGRGFAFPCDAAGEVAVDSLSARARVSYQQARGDVGIELSDPVVSVADDTLAPAHRTGQLS